jgi:hypothetical protein
MEQIDCATMVPQDMMFYEDRLETFKTWSNQIIPKKYTSAKACFFYTLCGDITECFAGHVKVRDWNTNDIALDEHLKFSPQCVFLKMLGYGCNDHPDNKNQVNNPFSSEPQKPLLPMTQTSNIFGHPAPANCFVGRPEKPATDFGTLSGGFKWPSK